MKLALGRSDYFNRDFDLQYRWYLEHADEAVAERYFSAVWLTLDELALQPGIGHLRRFRNPELSGLRSLRIRPPFNVHLVFYRHTQTDLFVERITHGSRDLLRRLVEPPQDSEE